MCPYCEKVICCDDFEKRHIKDCYKKATDEGGLIVLPEKGSVVKFKNHKNRLERPYVCIADLDSTLLKNKIIKVNKKGEPLNTQIIHEHKPNRAALLGAGA